MSIMKVMIVLTLVVAVAIAADSKTADASNVVGSMLAAKTRLPTVNATLNATLNATESANSTVHTMNKRSLIDKSEGKSAIFSAFWRIPTAIWRFVYDILLSPIFSSLHGLLSLFGLNSLFGLDNDNSFGQQFVNTLPTTHTFANMVPQLTTPMAPPVAVGEPAWSP